MARHSCGHKAGPFTPPQAVRAMPRCTDCQSKAELEAELKKKLKELYRIYPTKSASDVDSMLVKRAGSFRGQTNLYKLIAAADDIMAEHMANDIDAMEVDYVETSYRTTTYQKPVASYIDRSVPK